MPAIVSPLRPAALYFIEHPQMRGTFLTINGIDRWGFLVNSLAAYGYTASDFTPERSAEIVRTAAGVPNLDVRILGVVPWAASARVAERYRTGRIFLAGDAAHEIELWQAAEDTVFEPLQHGLAGARARLCR